MIGPFWAATEHDLMTRLDEMAMAVLSGRGASVPSEVQRDVDYALSAWRDAANLPVAR